MEEAPIDEYAVSIQNSLVESVKTIKTKIKERYKSKYLYIILGKSLFLGSIKARNKSIEGKIDRYTSGIKTVNVINEMVIISSTMRNVSNWFGRGKSMRLPNVPEELEKRINKEREKMGASKLCELESSDIERLYFLLLDKLKPYCDNGKLNVMYKEIGRYLENILFNEDFVNYFKGFREKYESTKDKIQKVKLCASLLQIEERLIAQKLGRTIEGVVIFSQQ